MSASPGSSTQDTRRHTARARAHAGPPQSDHDQRECISGCRHTLSTADIVLFSPNSLPRAKALGSQVPITLDGVSG